MSEWFSMKSGDQQKEFIDCSATIGPTLRHKHKLDVKRFHDENKNRLKGVKEKRGSCTSEETVASEV